MVVVRQRPFSNTGAGLQPFLACGYLQCLLCDIPHACYSPCFLAVSPSFAVRVSCVGPPPRGRAARRSNSPPTASLQLFPCPKGEGAKNAALTAFFSQRFFSGGRTGMAPQPIAQYFIDACLPSPA